MQLATAMKNTSVLAEEMGRDHHKWSELQDKPAGNTKESSKWRKCSLPDPSEAVEKRAAKLEQLYNDSVQHIQVTLH